jgi:hypothetical protein
MMQNLLPSLASQKSSVVKSGEDGISRISKIDTNYLKIILDQNVNRQYKLWNHIAY